MAQVGDDTDHDNGSTDSNINAGDGVMVIAGRASAATRPSMSATRAPCPRWPCWWRSTARTSRHLGEPGHHLEPDTVRRAVPADPDVTPRARRSGRQRHGRRRHGVGYGHRRHVQPSTTSSTTTGPGDVQVQRRQRQHQRGRGLPAVHVPRHLSQRDPDQRIGPQHGGPPHRGHQQDGRHARRTRSSSASLRPVVRVRSRTTSAHHHGGRETEAVDSTPAAPTSSSRDVYNPIGITYISNVLGDITPGHGVVRTDSFAIVTNTGSVGSTTATPAPRDRRDKRRPDRPGLLPQGRCEPGHTSTCGLPPRPDRRRDRRQRLYHRHRAALTPCAT